MNPASILIGGCEVLLGPEDASARWVLSCEDAMPPHALEAALQAGEVVLLAGAEPAQLEREVDWLVAALRRLGWLGAAPGQARVQSANVEWLGRLLAARSDDWPSPAVLYAAAVRHRPALDHPDLAAVLVRGAGDLASAWRAWFHLEATLGADLGACCPRPVQQVALARALGEEAFDPREVLGPALVTWCQAQGIEPPAAPLGVAGPVRAMSGQLVPVWRPEPLRGLYDLLLEELRVEGLKARGLLAEGPGSTPVERLVRGCERFTRPIDLLLEVWSGHELRAVAKRRGLSAPPGGSAPSLAATLLRHLGVPTFETPFGGRELVRRVRRHRANLGGPSASQPTLVLGEAVSVAKLFEISLLLLLDTRVRLRERVAPDRFFKDKLRGRPFFRQSLGDLVRLALGSELGPALLPSAASEWVSSRNRLIHPAVDGTDTREFAVRFVEQALGFAEAWVTPSEPAFPTLLAVEHKARVGLGRLRWWGRDEDGCLRELPSLDGQPLGVGDWVAVDGADPERAVVVPWWPRSL